MFDLEGRQEIFAAVEIVEGSFDDVQREIACDEVAASRWRISQVVMPPPWAQNGLPIVVLEGPRALSAGMVLHD
jgi:hypothetical protein